MNFNKLAVVLPMLFTGVFFISTSSLAGKPPKCDSWPECKDDGGGNSDEYTGTEGVQFIPLSGDPNFDYHIVGTPDQDEIIAGSGRDLIETGASFDRIDGRGNDDEIRAGDGNDEINAGDGNDEVFGDTGNDMIEGGSGTDQLYGGAGDDALFVSLGQFNGIGYDVDTFDGGDGDNDELHFGYFGWYSGVDVSGVTVDLAAASYEAIVYIPALDPILIEGSFENIEKVFGSNGNDFLYGTDGPDRLNGSDGSDVVHGLGGNDEGVGGGPGDDFLFGGPGDDNVNGGNGSDHMYGEDGNDRLMSRGDAANDQMSGGPGCDTFVLLRQFGADTITDFEDGCDRIDLSDYNPVHKLDFNDLDIDTSGNDIIIDFWFKKYGGTGGTIILKDGISNLVNVDASDFVF